MGSRAYNRFIKVLEKWPKDESKAGKDIGEGLRLKFSQEFPNGPTSILADEKYLHRQIDASKLLTEDFFVKKHPRLYDSNFTGVELDDLKMITSTQTMAELSGTKIEAPTLMNRLTSVFKK
eukprot:TRINITY_DN37233_c0_g1_i1.p1 TRINITY_DN37233_c0_g1~~TRINITY_DN37233_c0_g1_i1.p1  ORF type:complete len:121 (+),score=11.84 TRINITY_DN37233_c0_g1_i1:61-423(+)